MRRTIRRFIDDERGATAIEYGLIIAVLSLAIVVGVGGVSDRLTALWNGNDSKIANAFR